MSEARQEPRAWLPFLADHVEGQVDMADRKAGHLLTVNSLLLTGLSVLSEPLINRASRTTVLLAVICALSLFASLFLVLCAIAPSQRHAAPDAWFSKPAMWRRILIQPNGALSSEPSGLVSFFSIARMPEEDFIDEAGNVTTVELERQLLAAVHGKSSWASHKFSMIDRAVKATIVAVALAFAATIVGSLGSLW